MQPVISIKNVSVQFPMYNMGARSLKKSIASFATGGLIKADHTGKGIVVVEALQDISLDLVEGDRVALLGHNGAGKSTLLRVVGGIYEPTIGEVEVNGRISCLLDIGVGAEGDATGFENIRLRGMLHGMTQAEIDDLTPEIAEFSGLGDYLKMPLRTYSSGMMMRLAFSVATCAQREVLIMDEWLGTGDKSFTYQASARLKKIVGGAKVLMLASHNTELISEICNKAALMEHGRIMEYGEVGHVIERYLK